MECFRNPGQICPRIITSASLSRPGSARTLQKDSFPSADHILYFLSPHSFRLFSCPTQLLRHNALFFFACHSLQCTGPVTLSPHFQFSYCHRLCREPAHLPRQSSVKTDSGNPISSLSRSQTFYHIHRFTTRSNTKASC
jgi:hypothetical protein